MEAKRIDDLKELDLAVLVKESEEEGYRFLKRLVTQYDSGENTFNKPGEALYGVWDSEGKLVAVGGLNINPFSDSGTSGRLRRFYVSPSARRKGAGTLLLHALLDCAQGNFREIVLRTDSATADAFYRANGFLRTEEKPEVTHKRLLQTTSADVM